MLIKLNGEIELQFKNLKDLEIDTDTAITNLKDSIQFQMNTVFDNDNAIQKLLTDLNNSRTYAADENNKVFSWVLMNGEIPKDLMEYFSVYLEKNHFSLRSRHVICYRQGMDIIIDNNGDVYDQDSEKCIVHATDYKTETERNRLIRDWMKSKGYFPGVFRMDRYTNGTMVYRVF